MVVLGATQPVVGTGSVAVAGAGAFAVFFLDFMADFGRKLDKVDKDSLNVYLQREDKYNMVEIRGIYKQMFSNREY